MVCFVVGGSQGARSINRALSAALDASALDGVTVLWSTGKGTWTEFERHHAPPGIQVKPFWDPVSAAYGAADLVIGRAGALTTAELSAWGLPAILIPLPSAAADHQTKNALALVHAGSALHVPESTLDPSGLAHQIKQLLSSPDRLADMARKATERSHPEAATRIAEQLLRLAD